MPVQNRVGPPVRGTDFFGRETFVDLVWEKLSGGHILLAAPRRFGKTSVLYRLIDEPRQGFKVIHADLEKFRHPSELMTELIVQLAKQDRLSKIVSRLTYFPSKLWKEFRNTVEEIDLYEFRLKLKQQLEEGWEEKADDLFSRIAACDETLIFILDELPMMIDFMRRTPEGRDEARSLLLWLRALRTVARPHQRALHRRRLNRHWANSCRTRRGCVDQ